MTNEIVFHVEAEPNGAFTARAVGHSIFTQADSWQELEANAREAALCRFDDNAPPLRVGLELADA